MKRSRALVAVGFVGLASAAFAQALGCDEFEAAPRDAAVAVDARPEAGPDECGQVGVPAPPSADSPEAGAGGSTSYVFALSSLDTVGPSGSSFSGFNLDRTCTDTRDAGSCLGQTEGIPFDQSIKDKQRGVDNAGSALFLQLSGVYDQLSASSINAELRKGKFGVVAKLSNYHGGEDDREVQLVMQPALGVVALADGGAQQADGGVPKFDGTDTWALDARYFAGNIAQFSADLAYVRGRRLVAHFRELLFSLSVPDNSRFINILISDAWLSGDVSVNNRELSLSNGMVGGRWPTKKLLRAFGELLAFGTPICNVSALYSQLKTSACEAQDITVSTTPNAAARCDAISIGFGFAARPANPDSFTRPPVSRAADTDLCRDEACALP